MFSRFVVHQCSSTKSINRKSRVKFISCTFHHHPPEYRELFIAKSNFSYFSYIFLKCLLKLIKRIKKIKKESQNQKMKNKSSRIGQIFQLFKFCSSLMGSVKRVENVQVQFEWFI